MSTISIIIPMYNASDYIFDTLDSVTAQLVPISWGIEIIVVDDASKDQSRKIVENFPDSRVRLICREENGGRAQARNSGLKIAVGDYCLFIDADCSYASCYAIKDYIYHFRKGVKACFGAVSASGVEFWEQYQRDNYLLRRTSGKSINLVTTQNFGAQKELLFTIGGFDTQYRKYGFEDRDLYLTINSYLYGSNIHIDPNIVVYHRDRISLRQVCYKMYESGYYSSGIFRKKFPTEYREMSYAKADLNLMPKKLFILLRLIYLGRRYLLEVGNNVIRSRALPYNLKRLTVKILSALYYMAGTGNSIKK